MSKQKRKTERAVIEAAMIRAMDNVKDPVDRPQHSFKGRELNGWKPDALASWIIQPVMRALQRHRNQNVQPPKKSKTGAVAKAKP